MITSLNYSSPQLEKIDDLLMDEANVMPLRYYKRNTEFRHEEKIYRRLYKLYFIGFPVEVVPRAYEVYIPHDDLINYHKYHALRNKTTDKMLMEMIEDTCDLRLRELVSSMVHEKIMNLSFEFESALKFARSYHVFAGITDNLTIIRNVLNLYINVRKRDDVQIAHLGHITLPKSISDLMTDIYITYLSDRLSMLEIKDVHAENSLSVNKDEVQKIKWNGQQQHLAELFLELKKKQWIATDEMSLQKTARLLSELFDLSHTKRKPGSDPANNIYQLLKGEFDKADNYERKHFSDTHPKYQRKFESILPLRK